MYFTLTAKQTRLAKQTLIAHAYYKLTKRLYEQFASDILATDDYYYEDNYCSGVLKELINTPADRIIRKTAHIEMMKGYRNTTTTEAETSASRFTKKLDKKAKAFGFLAGKNFHDVALRIRRERDRKLIKATCNLHGAYNFPNLNTKDKTYIITQLLDLFCCIDLSSGFMELEKLLFAPFLTFKSEAYPYIHQSFAEALFQCYKRFIPISKFLLAKGLAYDRTIDKNIVGVYAYYPGCYIFRARVTTTHNDTTETETFYSLSCHNPGTYYTGNIENLETEIFNSFYRKNLPQ